MKRIILFFAVCLGLSVSQTTFADASDTVRTASKRGTTTVTTTQSSGRSISTSAKRTDNSTNASKNTRTAAKPQQKVSSRTTTNQTGVKPRGTAIIKITPEQNERMSVPSRASVSRTVSNRQSESRSATTSSNKTSRTAVSTQKTKRASRATALNTEKISNIKSLDYSKCKTVYYECMDEFCANKDTNLRRCACSSRIHEFDNIKKQLSNAEDKMLDFNQRLLTVSLEKEDAAAINVATEGELAFQKKDTTESEKLLQKITKALNDSGDSKINNNLSAISLSLDMDTAWDDIDSLSGAATSAKNGVDLYNAASPVCVAMAREVCSDEELDIAKSGYKLTIQQDCDTVAKSYKTQYSNAIEKIHESAALLDMSRLNVYQQRNSDDMLTCKKKILNQLSDTAVCGKNLYKCLDTTGQYIDPSNGSAFLSEDLYNLTNLLQEPVAGEKWSKIAQNESFVNFLNSKKKFLEPATEQCQDISDVVWNEFVEDALGQIKLAQNAKLEEIRRSCTTLLTECKTQALQSLSDFDARALSAFSVAADKTANKMCEDIEISCNRIMSYNDIQSDWGEGMTGIAANVSSQKIKETCIQVGRDCIVQQCNATAGNFALCQNETSDIRTKILKQAACYDQIRDCVANADGMTNAENQLNETANTLLAEIWGDCTTNSEDPTSNTIIDGDSLLSWFATNTGTYSCNKTGCAPGYVPSTRGCIKKINQNTDDGGTATSANEIINVTENITNFCKGGILDVYGNCCTGTKNNGICVPASYTNINGNSISWQAARFRTITCTEEDGYLCPVKGTLTLYCVTKADSTAPIVYYADFAEYACGVDDNGTPDYDAMWVLVDKNGNYLNPDSSNIHMPRMFYRTSSNSCCQYKYNLDTTKWEWDGAACNTTDIPVNPTTQEFLIEYIGLDSDNPEQLNYCSLPTD